MGVQIMLHCAHPSCPIKQTTLLTHIPLVHDTALIHFNVLVMDFGWVNVFRVQKSNHQMHLTIGGIMTWFFIWHCDTATTGSANTEDAAEGLTTALDLQNLWWMTCADRAWKWFSL
jgi:hypothetical protein